MIQPKVSVIIPVYNTLPYIEESVGSILRQTLTDLQIIIVNDGSTDGSKLILDKLAKQDARIELYNQENQGLSCARNSGMAHANGKYIYFMDSDDMLAPSALATCYNQCEKENLDAVLFDAENLIDTQAKASIQNYGRKGCGMENKVWNGEQLLDYQIKHWLYRSPVWLHFVRTEFLNTYFKGFEPGKIHEDHLFTISVYLNAKRISYLPYSFFKRRIRSGSIMTNNFSMKNVDGYITALCSIRQLPGNEAVKKEFLGQMADAFIWEAHKLTLHDKFILLKRFKTNQLLPLVRMKTWIICFLKK